MVLQGKNLIISLNGVVFAASKSCLLNVDVESIKISSPQDGRWKHIIPGMMSWSFSTDHLLEAGQKRATVEAVAFTDQKDISFVKIGNNMLYASGIGLNIFGVRSDYSIERLQIFDTYNDLDAYEYMINYLDYDAPQETLIIISQDEFGLTDELKNAIEETMYVKMGDIPTGEMTGALAVIGSKAAWELGEDTGIALYSESVSKSVHAKWNLQDYKTPVINTPLRDAVKRVGQIFDVSLQVDEYGKDRLTGQALCKTFSVNSNIGNLMKGSFKFDGNGPLI